MVSVHSYSRGARAVSDDLKVLREFGCVALLETGLAIISKVGRRSQLLNVDGPPRAIRFWSDAGEWTCWIRVDDPPALVLLPHSCEDRRRFEVHLADPDSPDQLRDI